MNDQFKLIHGDCIEKLRELPENSIDVCITDPPYGIRFMGKAWDGKDIERKVEQRRAIEAADPGSDRPGLEGRVTAGPNAGYRSAAAEAGKYDRSPTANQAFQLWCEEWAREVFRVLKPGGHIAAFCSTRTYHRLAAGIEDAGFDVRDQMAWCYGSGFPKSLDVAKAIDASDRLGFARDRQLRFTAWMRSTGITADEINTATASCMASHYLTDKEQPAVATEDMFSKLRPIIRARGHEIPAWVEELVQWRTVESENLKKRKVTGTKTAVDLTKIRPVSMAAQGKDVTPTKTINLTEAHTETAKKWEGWGTALKPAWEPICLARKPFKGTIAGNVVKHGTAALARWATFDS